MSAHPGVTVEEVLDATGFPLLIDDVVTSREPTGEELELLATLDPKSLREKEVPE